ncbi:MAG: hypothetical protein FWC77_06890 [Defluviitaleaceae bacterium]|nr:hypothetical protein [Defluviitaleaceae bacterium]
MRNFMEAVVEWKSATAMMFSASVILCAVVMLLTGETSVPIPILLYLLVITGGGMFLQMFALTDRFIRTMGYTMRMIVFVASLLGLLVVSAWLFRLFPVEGIVDWPIISGIFLVVFVGGTISFEIYYRAMGKKYDGLLGQYRKQQELEK